METEAASRGTADADRASAPGHPNAKMAVMDSSYSEPLRSLLTRRHEAMALVCRRKPEPWAAAELAKARPAEWFPGARHPEAALAGLWLRFGEWDRAHTIAQDLPSAEGSYWHAIIHRQEPDGWNSGYWFRRVRLHPVFAQLAEEARRLSGKRPEARFTLKDAWDPFAFIEYCEGPARKAGSAAETLAMEIQEAEWRLLFGWCVRG